MGEGAARALLGAKRHEDPDLREGAAGASRCLSFRSSHLQIIFSGAAKIRNIGGLDIKNVFLQAGG